jgi:ABC-type lipoprotein release transport system permease subunit
VFLNAHVRLRSGEAAVAGFKADLARVSGRTDIDVWNMYEGLERQVRVTGFEADALLAFAVAAGIAAIVLVGQSIARYSSATVADLQTLRAMGLDRRQSSMAAMVGPVLAALVGTIVGTAAALIVSRWFPIGNASRLEPDPGFDSDPLVLVAGLVVVPLLAAAGATLASWIDLRPNRAPVFRSRLRVAGAAAAAGAPVPVVVGAQFALEPGRGRHAVPVRPAIFGAVIGVIGVVAAFTFSNGVHDAATNPSRFGQVFELQAFVGINDEDFYPVDDVLTVVADDPDVVAGNDSRTAVAEADGVAVALFTMAPVGAPLATVVTRGRMPSGRDELALAPLTAEALDVDVGDTIELVGNAGATGVTVTGLAFVPQHIHNDYASGGWLTSDGYDAIFDGFKFRTVEIALRPGADPEEVAGRIQERAAAIGAEGLEIGPPFATVEAVAELRQVQQLPVLLGGFLAVLALGAVGHALATAVRRRWHDVAVLRALGLTRRQSRGVVVTQATLLASIGLLVGVPVGIVLGRTVWRYVADTTPLLYVPPLAWWTVLLIVPAVLVAANLLAVRPGRRAASMPVGQVLRAE